ncbi:MAG TPA: AsmA-like C-terminal region-containing protein [Bacteroidia bacterium]|jgi:hypothetical protein|nr:AsmA-like C-terminal region-containing protein [Bacteroidia bacterium]
MKKVLKWTGISFLILLILLISLPFLFKGKLIQLAKDEANNNLNAKIDFGEFDLSIFSSFPDFRFSINNISVVGVGDFENDTLAALKKLQLDVNLMSVITGDQVKVEEIILTEPRISAIVMHNGKANWDITKPSANSAKKDTSGTKTKFKLSLKKFEITHAKISYNDIQGNMNAGLDDLDFTLKGDFTQDNFLMAIRTEIQKFNFSYGGVAYAKNMHVKLKIDLDADMPGMKFTFKENEIDLNELALGIDGFVAMPNTNINMDMKFLCKQTEFKNILSLIPAVYSKDFASVQTQGKLALNGYAKGIYNAVSLPAFGAHLEISQAMFKYPSLPKSVNNINVKADVENPNGKPDATQIDIHKFHVEMAGNPIDMIMHISTPVSDPSLNGEVKGKVDLSSVKEFVSLDKTDDMSGVVTADVKMKGKMSSITNKKYEEFDARGTVEVDKIKYKTASLPYDVLVNEMKLNFTPKYVELASFDSKMGNSDIKAAGKIENFMQYIFRDSLIKGSFSLNSSLIDLNQLMSSTTNTVAAGPAKTDTAKAAPMTVVEVPKNIDFMLNTNIAKLLYDKLEIINVIGEVVVRNARAGMSNLKMNLLDGSMIMNGYYDTKDKRKPAVNFNLNINEVDIQKTNAAFNTVQKLAPIANSARGKFSTTLNDFVTLLKPDMSPDMNTMSGHGTLKTKTVSIEDFPPFVKLDDALHLNKLKKVSVSDLNVEYEFKNGRVYTKPFKIKIAEIPAEISGSTGFDQSLDYKWHMELPTKLMGAQGQQMAQNWLSKASGSTGVNATLPEKMDVTALIGGTVTKPEIKTGLKSAMKDVKNEVKAIVEQKKEEVVKDAKEEASKQAEKILADAQKTADDIKAQAAKLADDIRKQGNLAADSVNNSAKGPIEKLAAKKIADGIRKQSEQKAQKATDEANAKADKIMADAHTQADKLKQ